jgi:hypothetical protein
LREAPNIPVSALGRGRVALGKRRLHAGDLFRRNHQTDFP